MTLGSGATDLLIEWEDMFPYWGPIANISAKWVTMNVTINMTMTIIMTKTMARKDKSHFLCSLCSRNSYTKAEVSSLLQVPVENLYPFHMLLMDTQAAKENDLGVIPLVQVCSVYLAGDLQ